MPHKLCPDDAWMEGRSEHCQECRVLLLNWEGGSDVRPAVLISCCCKWPQIVAFLNPVLCKMFSLFRAITLTLQLTALIHWTLCVSILSLRLSLLLPLVILFLFLGLVVVFIWTSIAVLFSQRFGKSFFAFYMLVWTIVTVKFSHVSFGYITFSFSLLSPDFIYSLFC
jgi:hypothetical protein